MQQYKITSHVLDASTGMPVSGMPVRLCRFENGSWQLLAETVTNSDGRVLAWPGLSAPLSRGCYRLRFDIDNHYGEASFYPYAEIVFRLQDERHHHIPLLLSPFSYSTYRGS